MNIAGVVVLYNPTEQVLENIQTYLPFLRKLYVMDNSTKELDFTDKIKELEKVEYISLGGNHGIAKALKIGTEKSIEENYDYVLSMDQDSKYPTEDFKYIEDYLEKCDISKVGAIGINFSGNRISVLSTDKSYVEKNHLLITSGMIIVSQNYKKIYGYNEDLFIDWVDDDVCMQLLHFGFELILFRNILLEHSLGIMETRKFLFLKVTKGWHSDLRLYYIFRNGTYLKKYKKEYFIKSQKNRINFLHRVYKVIFSSNRRKTLKMIKMGIKDGKNAKLGVYTPKD